MSLKSQLKICDVVSQYHETLGSYMIFSEFRGYSLKPREL